MSEAILRFIGTDEGLGAQFKKANDSLKQLEGNSNKTTALISKGFGAVAGILGAISFGRLASEALEFAEEMQTMSGRTGIAVEQLQKLQFVAAQSETQLEAVTSSLNKFQVNLVQNNAKTVATLNKLGISVDELRAMQPDKQFLQIAEAIASVPDPAVRAADAVEIFGREGTQLLPLINAGSKAIGEMAERFDELGVAVSAEAIGKVDDLGDSFSRLGIEAKSLATELLALGQPVLQPLAQGLEELISDIRVFTGEAPKLAVIEQNLRFLREERSTGVVAFGKSLFNPEGGLSFLTPSEIDRQIVVLEHARDLIKSVKEVALQPISTFELEGIDLSRFTPTAKRAPLRDFDTAAFKRDAFLAEDNPEIIQAQSDADMLVQINQRKVDELLRQETESSTALLDLSGNTHATLLDGIEAFSGQAISWAHFRADFEQNSALATAGLLGEVAANVFENNKAFAIAQSVISTYTGVTRALADFPYPYNIAVGALVAAQGFAQVQKIRSTRKGGGGGGASFASAGGSSAGVATGVSRDSGGVAAGKPGATQKPQSVINVYGWSESAIRELVKRIKEETGDHDLTLIRN